VSAGSCVKDATKVGGGGKSCSELMNVARNRLLNLIQSSSPSHYVPYTDRGGRSLVITGSCSVRIRFPQEKGLPPVRDPPSHCTPKCLTES
jgi:hypothetical protein